MNSENQKLQSRVAVHIKNLEQKDNINQSKYLNQTNILNGFSHNQQFRKASIINFVFLISLIVQYFILFSYIQSDFLGDQRAYKFLQFSSIWCIFGSIILIMQHHLLNNYYSICQQEESKLKNIFFSIIVYNIMPFPFLENISTWLYYQKEDTYIQIKLNYILSILATFRSIYFLKNFILQSKYMNSRSFRVGNFFGSKLSKYSTLRCLFKDHPFQFVGILFVLSVLSFTFSFRIAEQYRYRNSKSFTIYSNMIWMTMMTMTSVGFGQYNCSTFIGRLLGGFCATWGILIVSLMVAVLTHFLSMTQDESQSLKMLKRLQIKSHLRKVAGDFIRQRLWRVWTNYKYKLSIISKKKQRILRMKLNILKNADHKTNLYQQKLRIFDEMQSQFLNVLSRLQNLKENNLLFMSYFTQNFYFDKTQSSDNFYSSRMIIKV